MTQRTIRSAAQETAHNFVVHCRDQGWTPSVEREIVTIRTTFEPGDNDAYVKADGEAYFLLSELPRTSAGSTWGTTSDGVGGQVGKDQGRYELHVSGVSKRVLKALVIEIAKDNSPDNQIDRA